MQLDDKTDRFIKQIRNREYFFFGNAVDLHGFDWYAFLRLMYTHPDKQIAFGDQSKRIELRSLHNRARSPQFAKGMNKYLKDIFKQNLITNIAFCGPDLKHKSFKIHRDSMDVIYIQVLGSIEWSVWDSDTKEDSFEFPETPAKMVAKFKMIPGDVIYIPRGMFHHVEPLSGRVGFSFGVEGQPDPATYV